MDAADRPDHRRKVQENCDFHTVPYLLVKYIRREVVVASGVFVEGSRQSGDHATRSGSFTRRFTVGGNAAATDAGVRIDAPRSPFDQ